MSYLTKSQEMLNRWINYSTKNDLYIPPERPDLMCYGSGYNGWGMQTHQKGLASFAIAATTDMHTDIPKEELLDMSLKMFRYMMETHIEGSYYAVEGDKWGHTWISALGSERVMHAIDRLIPYMTETDKKLMEKVFVSEADWLLNEYPVVAAKEHETGHNKPESNMWNGAFLHRVSRMYPHTPNADKYIEKGDIFLVNSISIDADATSENLYDGKAVKDMYVGSNFFDDYALDHHGYLNLGYMVITLSNTAIYHFACKYNHFPVPEALYHHAADLWKRVKSMMFKDGRLIRIGGDSRVRYCYCQDYAIPMLLFIEDYLGDPDAKVMLSGLVDMYETEMNNNNDGSFLSERCDGFKRVTPIYYTRLESDRASMLSMILAWEEMIHPVKETIVDLIHDWKEEYHGAYMVRGKKRLASWVARGCDNPVCLCLPIDRSDLAEWKFNLTGMVTGMGSISTCNITAHKEYGFAGGFAAIGSFNLCTDGFMAEQQKPEITSKLVSVCAALPDDATMVVMQYAVSPNRIYTGEARGILYNVPNDIFNGKERKYYYDGEYHMIAGASCEEECIAIKDDYINVDDILGIYGGYGKKYTLYRPGSRNIGIKIYKNRDLVNIAASNSFYCDCIMKTCDLTPGWRDKDEVIIDEGAILTVGVNGQETKELAKKVQNISVEVKASSSVRSMTAAGADGNTYVVIANLGQGAEKVDISGGIYVDVTDGKTFDGNVEAFTVKVLKQV